MNPISPIPDELLFKRLRDAGAKCAEGAFKQAYAQINQQQFDSPLSALNLLFQQLSLQGFRANILVWRRFDRRLLPALMFFDEQWWQVTNGEPGEVILDNEQEQRVLADTQAEEALILWIRAPQNQQVDTSDLKVNAKKLILTALFRHKAWLSNVIIATVIVNFLAIFTSLFAMQVYDRVVPTLAWATLTTLVFGMLIVAALDWVLKNIRAKIIDSLAANVDRELSQHVYEHLLSLRLDNKAASLGVVNAQVNGLESVRQFFTSGIVFGLVDLPFAVFFIAVIALIGGHIAWVYTALLIIALVLGFFIQLGLKQLIKHQIIRSNERQGLLIDTIRGAETIRTTNASWRFASQWKTITGSIANYHVRQKSISHLGSSLTATLSSLAYISAIVVGVMEIDAGNLTVGGLIACTILGGRVIAPVAKSTQYLMSWQSVAQSIALVDQLLASEQERRPEQKLLFTQNDISQVQLHKLRFFYADSPVHQLAIPDLTFSSGDRVLLVGPVGCGKSTLLKVLAGLYRPAEGSVKVDNLDLWEIDPHIIAAQVSYLPQQVHLFKGTLKENLSLSGTVSDNHVMDVASALGVDEIARHHPMGMDCPLAEGGEGLSGGQRQLVALTRTIAAQPRIWLLDEPTASLDNDTEQKAWQVIKERIKPDDILVVSTHRPVQALSLANRVIVMQHGEVVQDGKPEHVMTNLRQQGNNRPLPTASQAHGKGGLNVI
ncbi:ATP-binding cassette domain-containing protein [Flavobacterium sp. W21_SRS_FM6]|uniref:ATP-binding cassette domain-containing protein n=1 Tax=Flavobacterium sp. W21_SRS_FM6 TaxID=3240268 RepID=UPI003F8E5DFA